MNPKVCAWCRRNKHGKCQAHEFDPFEPSLFDDCGCACKGQVKQGGRLIDLVGELRLLLEDSEKKVAHLTRSVYEAGRTEGKFQKAISEFIETWVDDEGDLLSINKNRRWENGVKEMIHHYYQILDSITPSEDEPEEVDEDADEQ